MPLLLLIVAATLPLAFPLPYLRHLMVTATLSVALALSFDLLAGHLGAVSLAHPAFFGMGAYAAAVLNTRFHAPLLMTLPAAALGGAALALVLGVPLFRLSELSFAIGTLGLSLIARSVANNWVDVTGGAMCTTGIAPPALPAWWPLPVGLTSNYLALALAALAALTYVLLTTFRVGRALAAVQGDETFASSFGFDPLRYKVLTFAVSGTIAAVVGGFYAHYTTVICPNDLSTFLTINLLVMVFVGGLGSLRGVLIGAVLFTAVPELARFAQERSQLVYGILLLATIAYAPRGIEGVFRRRGRAILSDEA